MLLLLHLLHPNPRFVAIFLELLRFLLPLKKTYSLVLFPRPSVNMTAQTVTLKVAMTCEGCVGAVKRAIGKLDGVENYDINLKEQKVTIVGNVQPDAVLDRVSKTGKAATFWTDEKTAAA